MSEETLKLLCEIVKKECRITWEDADTENKIKDIVENAVPALSHKLGIKRKDIEVFAKPGMERTLFRKYCLYDWNNMLPDFDENYKSAILIERHRYEVKYEKEESE